MLQEDVNLLLPDFVKNTKAPLAHLFGNHEHCGKDWCLLALQAQKENKVIIHKVGCWLKILNIRRFMTSCTPSEHYLRQSRHPFNTQTNEALNQSQTRVAPKSWVFHESKAFHYQHANVIGCHNWGYKKYCQEYLLYFTWYLLFGVFHYLPRKI